MEGWLVSTHHNLKEKDSLIYANSGKNLVIIKDAICELGYHFSENSPGLSVLPGVHRKTVLPKSS